MDGLELVAKFMGCLALISVTPLQSNDAVGLNLLWNASLDIEIDAQAAFNRDYAAGKI